ncbi:predicted protein [Nematostella vectensis]|uniref:Uncharacterized protein n=2 Tax=Nematostella vectensis TaxID=45351 RepID=A7T0J3_NEMVE|nr:predicted protein [Nematostella vectensis]|eukprot:XP_001622623.1 predicted protein [Nematostella vectensis]
MRNQRHSPPGDPTELMDDEEKRLLQSMGWKCDETGHVDGCCCSDDDSGISEQDILRFKANQKSVSVQRQELREKLLQKFNNLSQKPGGTGGGSGPGGDAITKQLNGLNIGVVH